MLEKIVVKEFIIGKFAGHNLVGYFPGTPASRNTSRPTWLLLFSPGKNFPRTWF